MGVSDQSPALPEQGGPETAAPPLRSLQEDLEALVEDGRTYLAAELAFQKVRAAFLAEQAKRALVLGVLGALFASLTLIGLVVGLIVALAPLIGPWVAVMVVVAALALCTVLALLAAQRRWASLMSAILPAEDGAPN